MIMSKVETRINSDNQIFCVIYVKYTTKKKKRFEKFDSCNNNNNINNNE